MNDWEALIPYCGSARQREIVELRSNGMTAKAVALHLGIHERNVMEACARVKRNAAKQGYSPGHDMMHTVPDGFSLSRIYLVMKLVVNWFLHFTCDRRNW